MIDMEDLEARAAAAAQRELCAGAGYNALRQITNMVRQVEAAQRAFTRAEAQALDYFERARFA